MRTSVGGAALAALLGGTAGSLVSLWMVDRTPSSLSVKEEGVASASTRKTPRANGALRKSGRDIEEGEGSTSRLRMAELERRVSLLTSALAMKDGGVTLRAEDGATTDVADPVFEAAVLDIMDRQEERRESQDTARKAVERKERSQRFASRLSTSMGLSASEELDDEQKEKIAEVVTSYFDRVREIRQGDPTERPVTRAEWRERMGEVTKKSEDELMSVLSPDQKTKYEALDDDEKIGFGRFSPPREGRAPGTSQRAPAPE